MRIFLDTNFIFKLLRFVKKYGNIRATYVKRLANKYTLIISDYVVEELLHIHLQSKLWFEDKREFLYFLYKVLREFWIKIFESKKLADKYLKYVYDINDAQILQDAVESQSQVLFTDNIKDFKIDLIKEELGIIVTKSL
jgi:predicted nucleic acid-binding protein